MTVSTASFLAAFRRRFPNDHIDTAVSALPERWQKMMLEPLPKEVFELEQLFTGYRRIEGWLHSSWQDELIEGLPVQVRTSLLTLQNRTKNQLSPYFERFLLEYAVAHSPFRQVEDISFSAHSDAAWLLQLSEKDLLTVIELLALFPLIEPFLHILDKPRLQKLAFILTNFQKKFLSYLLLASRPGPFEPIDLHELLVKNKANSAKVVLFERGVQLLSQALYGESEALIWHICYKVDKELGKRIYFAWQQEQKKSEKPEMALVALDIVHTFMKGRK